MSNDLNLGMFQSTPKELDADSDARARCPVTGMAAEFEPFDDAYIANPFAFFRKARSAEPIFHDPKSGYWVVTKYDEIVRVFRDPETFSAALARHPVTPLCPAAADVRDSLDISVEPSLVDEDPETHRAHRKVFGDAFTPKRVEQVEPRIRSIVSGFIDRFAAKGEADLVAEMLYEVPALAIFIFLGAADDHAVRVKQLGSARGVVNWGRPSEAEQVAIMHDMGEHWAFTKKLVDDAYENPGDNYLGDMVRLHKADPDKFTINYLCNVMFLMQFAGHETTTQASANGMRALLEDRAQWEALCNDPSLIPGAVEEILRYDSSIFTWRRIATKDAKIGDFDVPKGAKILLAIGSGSRDEAAFADGDKFDILRKQEKKHLAFGNGAHFCMGAPLARLEMKIILEELTRRLPHMKLVPGQEWEYIPTLAFRGIQRLLIEWDPSRNP
ncbi:MAG: cytochrome P450 [Rhodospirillales bacterium]|nr:cytochrome P450 [Rhodospirillales bacterium]